MTKTETKHPTQPLATDAHGVMRFKRNSIVQYLLESHPYCDMNMLACMEFSKDDRQQLAQLTGYSLSGYGDLPYVDDHAYEVARLMSIDYAITEEDAQITTLRNEAAAIREAAKALRGPLAVLLGMYSDNLRG